MVSKNELKNQAISLRQRGFTLQEIAKVCDVAKSTVSRWLRHEEFSRAVSVRNATAAQTANGKRLTLMAKSRAHERALRYADARAAAVTEFRNYQADLMFRAGVMLFAAAGDCAARNVIRFHSSRPALHRQFHAFTERFLGVSPSRLRFSLTLATAQPQAESVAVWAAAIKLPQSQWYAIQRVRRGKRKPLHFGHGNTIIGSTQHLQKLLTWVELAEAEW